MPPMHESGTFDTSRSEGGTGAVRPQSESPLYRIFHASPLPSTISSRSSGRLIEVNEQWVRLTGYSASEAIGKTPGELGIWEDDAPHLQVKHEVPDHIFVQNREMNVHTRSGELRTVLLSAQQIELDCDECVFEVMTDVTERKQRVQALRESEQQFHMLADSAPVLIWLADEMGAFTYFNRSWLAFTGRSLDAQLNGGWADSVHPDDLSRCRGIFERAYEAGISFSREYRLRRRDGAYRWVLDRGVPRYQPDGSFSGYIGSCVDINEQKETEQALVEAKEHAQEMSSLKATFLTNITHEIRTPLTVILGFTSILRQGVRPEYQRFVNLIERSGRRLLLMLDSMLDLAQLEAGTLEVDRHAQSVADVVEGVVALVRPMAEEKGLELNVTIREGRHLARFDFEILSRALNNILDNAIKFTESGSIDIEVSRTGGRIRVAIEDTGVGIEEKFLSRVFDPFVQESTGLDRTHQGSGIGLSVSKRLVELMGGSIELASRKNKGTTFTVMLPGLG